MTNVPQLVVLWMRRSQAHQDMIDASPVSMPGPTRQWDTVVFAHTLWITTVKEKRTTKHDS